MSFGVFCDSLYHYPIQIMRYETFVINIIIEKKNIWENPITYQWCLKINRWYSNKIRCKKKKRYPNEKLPSMPLKTQSKDYAFERQMKAQCEDLCESESLCQF